PLSRGGIRLCSFDTISPCSSLSSGLPAAIGSPLAPPESSFSNDVMSNFPDFFLASWQAKQFSLRIGATSLMKLTGWADAVGGAANMSRYAIAAATAHRMHTQNRRRSMGRFLNGTGRWGRWVLV